MQTNNSQYQSAWLEINLGAIQNNLKLMRQQSGVQVMAVVKANGYGHGAVPVAQAALQAGAAWCGVARMEEALELRQAGLECPILLLGYTPPECIQQAIQNNLSMAAWDYQQIDWMANIAQRYAMPARLHLKIDTGMSRLGIQPEQAAAMASYMVSKPGIIFEGLFTHFACADEPTSQSNDLQEDNFNQVLQSLETRGLRPPWVHASNSAAGLTRSSTNYDLIRMGIAMYGLHPSNECLLPVSYRSAMAWKTTLSLVKTLPAGRGISYGHKYITIKKERIGTIPIGYADGFRRTAGNQVLIAGHRVPVVGRVCMDQIMVKLDEVPQARMGDEVVIIGAQGDEHLTAEEVASCWNTINYEVVCGIGPRVPRLYI